MKEYHLFDIANIVLSFWNNNPKNENLTKLGKLTTKLFSVCQKSFNALVINTARLFYNYEHSPAKCYTPLSEFLIDIRGKYRFDTQKKPAINVRVID